MEHIVEFKTSLIGCIVFSEKLLIWRHKVASSIRQFYILKRLVKNVLYIQVISSSFLWNGRKKLESVSASTHY